MLHRSLRPPAPLLSAAAPSRRSGRPRPWRLAVRSSTGDGEGEGLEAPLHRFSLENMVDVSKKAYLAQLAGK